MATATASSKLEQLHDHILARQAILGRKGIISAIDLPDIAKTYVVSALRSIGMSNKIIPTPQLAKVLTKAFTREIALWEKLREQVIKKAAITSIQRTMTDLSDLLESEHVLLESPEFKKVA